MERKQHYLSHEYRGATQQLQGRMALGTVRAQDHAATQVARVKLIMEGHEVLFAGVHRRKMDGAYKPQEKTVFVKPIGGRAHSSF